MLACLFNIFLFIVLCVPKSQKERLRVYRESGGISRNVSAILPIFFYLICLSHWTACVSFFFLLLFCFVLFCFVFVFVFSFVSYSFFSNSTISYRIRTPYNKLIRINVMKCAFFSRVGENFPYTDITHSSWIYTYSRDHVRHISNPGLYLWALVRSF